METNHLIGLVAKAVLLGQSSDGAGRDVSNFMLASKQCATSMLRCFSEMRALRMTGCASKVGEPSSPRVEFFRRELGLGPMRYASTPGFVGLIIQFGGGLRHIDQMELNGTWSGAIFFHTDWERWMRPVEILAEIMGIPYNGPVHDEVAYFPSLTKLVVSNIPFCHFDKLLALNTKDIHIHLSQADLQSDYTWGGVSSIRHQSLASITNNKVESLEITVTKLCDHHFLHSKWTGFLELLLVKTPQLRQLLVDVYMTQEYSYYRRPKPIHPYMEYEVLLLGNRILPALVERQRRLLGNDHCPKKLAMDIRFSAKTLCASYFVRPIILQEVPNE